MRSHASPTAATSHPLSPSRLGAAVTDIVLLLALDLLSHVADCGDSSLELFVTSMQSPASQRLTGTLVLLASAADVAWQYALAPQHLHLNSSQDKRHLSNMCQRSTAWHGNHRRPLCAL